MRIPLPPQFLALAAILVLACAPLAAQSSMGSISGIVTDPSGAAVVNVSIKVTDVDRNVDYRTVTNETGFYLMGPLQAGNYRVAAESAGMRPYVLQGLPLAAQQKASVNVTLELGEVTQSVSVSAGAQMIEPNTQTLGSTVEFDQITDLPLNDRNIYMLVTLTPGVTNEAIGEEWWQGSKFSMNGGRESSNALFFDGVAGDASFQAPGSSGVTMTPSIESVEQVRVLTSMYSAEYGRSGGGVVTMVSKSGTNQVHGSLFDFLRNSVLDSNNFFANRAARPLVSFQRNQFGASVGGPVWLPGIYSGRNKTFFFTTYEGRRVRSGTTATQSLPSALERAGDFSQTFNAAGALRVIYDPFSTRADPARAGRFIRDPFAGNLLPANRLDPVAQKAQSYYPQPNTTGNLRTHQNNFVRVTATSQTSDSGSVKIDHYLNERQRVFFRYAIKNTQSAQPDVWGKDNPGCTGGCWGQYDRQQNAALDYTHTLTASTLLNVRYGFGRAILDRLPWSYGFNSASLGLPASVAQIVDMPTFPTVTVQDMTGLGLAQGIPYTTASMTHSLIGNVTLIKGRHSIKIGIESRFNFLNGFQSGTPPPSFDFTSVMTQGPDARTSSTSAGVGYASFLLGAGASGSMPHGVRSATANRYAGLYIQEDYKMNKRVSINVGLRWDLEPGETERYDRLAVFDPNVASPAAKQFGMDLRGGYRFPGKDMDSRAATGAYLKAINPRFGLSFQITPKTVIRTGYGIFFSAPVYNASSVIATPFNSATTWVPSLDGITPYRFMSNPFPDGYSFAEGSRRGLLAGFGQGSNNAFIPEAEKPPPYNQQWNFSIQRAIVRNTIGEVAYSGNKGTHLPFEFPNYQLNQLNPQLLSAGDKLLELVPNPFYGFVQGGTLGQAQVQRGQLLRPFPQYTTVAHIGMGWGNSTYHALHARAERRFARGSSVSASYSWSKTMSDGNDGLWLRGFSIRDYHCRSCEHSLSSIDQPHRLTAYFTYEMPFGRGKRFGGAVNRWVNAVLGNWQTNGILTISSGRPLLFTTAENTSYSFGGGQHPDSTGASADLGDARTINRWFDTTQFLRAAPYTFGNVGRTHPNLRQDRYENLDLSLFKTFVVRERVRAQFRAEAFNTANHPIFGAPNTQFGSAQFGIIGAQGNIPRQIQFALKILW